MTDQRGKNYKRASWTVAPSHLDALEELARRWDCNKSEVVRTAIEELWQRESTGQVAEFKQALSGSDDERLLKQRAVDLFRLHKGPAVVAKELGVSRRVLSGWFKSDPNFAELAQEARDYSVERIEYLMWQKAKDGNVKAQFGILNANHEAFGFVRQVYIEKGFKNAVGKVVLPLVARYLPADQLRQFSQELRVLIERHFA